MTSADVFAMTSAVRRPSLNSFRADDAPTCWISVSATMSCLTPANARDCKNPRDVETFFSPTFWLHTLI